MELRELVEVEARAAQRSGPQLSDDAVGRRFGRRPRSCAGVWLPF